MKSNEGAAADKKPGRFALLFTRHRKNEEGLQPKNSVPEAEGEREKQDLGRVLDQLNLCACHNKVVSTDSSELLQKFTQVFKDLVNGVLTACNDLTRLVEDRDGTLSRGFDKLPASLKRLVAQLPDKVVGSLAPEILAAAGLKGAAKKMLLPHNLAELLTKPGVIVGMLRAIVEMLKARWPAFVGMNVLWSVALSCEFPPPIDACPSRRGLLRPACSVPLRAVVLPQARSRGAPREPKGAGGRRRQ